MYVGLCIFACLYECGYLCVNTCNYVLLCVCVVLLFLRVHVCAKRPN